MNENEAKSVKNTGRRNFVAGLVFSLAMFVLSFLINRNVSLFQDDYYYMTFTWDGLAHFFERHKVHYLTYNGRALMHILITLFLSVDMKIWAVFNSALMGVFIFLGSKVAKNSLVGNGAENSDYTYVITCMIVFAATCFLNTNLISHGVYWLTGSFNYFIPLVIFLWYWYGLKNLNKFKRPRMILLLAFFSSATVEQVALMTIGLTMLMIIDIKFIKGEKVDELLYACLAFSVLGAASMLFASGQFRKFEGIIGARRESSFLRHIWGNFAKLLKHISCIEYMKAPNIFALLASGIGIYKMSIKCRKSIQILLKICAGFCVSAGLVLLCSHDVFNNFAVLSKESEVIYVAWCYHLGLMLNIFLLLKTKYFENYITPVIAATLSLGAQFMLIVLSEINNHATCLASAMMLIIYSASLIPMVATNANKVKRVFSMVLCMILVVFSVKYIKITIDKYAINKGIWNENVEAIEEYRINPNGALFLKRYPIGRNDWFRTPESDPEAGNFKSLFGIPYKTELVWIDPE